MKQTLALLVVLVVASVGADAQGQAQPVDPRLCARNLANALRNSSSGGRKAPDVVRTPDVSKKGDANQGFSSTYEQAMEDYNQCMGGIPALKSNPVPSKTGVQVVADPKKKVGAK